MRIFSFSVISLCMLSSAFADALPSRVLAPQAVALGIHAEATVEAVQQATVAAQVTGRIVDVRVDAGAAVKKGDVLMRIDAREAAEAAQAAQSQLAVAQAQFERNRQLRQQNFISQAGLDKAKADYDAAKAGAAQASVGLGHASVASPIGGLIARRHAEAGEMASPGRALVTVYDPASLRVTASIPQYQLGEMRRAKTARVEFPELGRSADATSVTLLPTADASTHVSQVRVGLPANLEGVVPGMFARVTFITGQAEKLTVPAAAIAHRGEVTAVYVETEQGLQLRQLRLGENFAGEYEVLAGIVAGERVVLDPVRAAIRLKSAANR
ncbi:MAG: efflux RND transporter periplasmic adaptor subunit [Betaproteobacteria bacterium]|uniref:Efflux RND transporter periplasmic adaptor subunit n=1 Tax=Candidatus Proximibacter danicus TaxID=2954365 RepID=A0A9D7K2K2_9PROT|nr:efflux RND transporter periplasmic adaptor subunit [Candidatus Proximibacter danicus]